MPINKLWIACTALMVGILWVMTFVNTEYIIKQGRQIKQLEVALAIYKETK